MFGSGGSVLFDDGHQIINAYCSHCHRSGLPVVRKGAARCIICGAVIIKGLNDEGTETEANGSENSHG